MSDNVYDGMDQETLFVAHPRVNLRAEPSTDARIVRVLAEGMPVLSAGISKSKGHPITNDTQAYEILALTVNLLLSILSTGLTKPACIDL